MKLKKGIPVIDHGNKLGFWGGKFGGNFVPETLKKPIEDLEVLFNKLKKDKKLFNIAGKLSLNEWQGQSNVEFIIDDISVNKTIKKTVPSSIG